MLNTLLCVSAAVLLAVSNAHTVPISHRPTHRYTLHRNSSSSSSSALRLYHPLAFTHINRAYHPFVRYSDPSVPLDGSVAFGEYYIALSFGTDTDKFNVQVDTGSSDLAVVSSRLPSPPAKLPVYNPWAHSDTASPVPCSSSSVYCSCKSNVCDYSISYLDGSGYTADVFEDTITFPGSALKVRSITGAIVKQSKGFESAPVAGIVGVAYRNESEILAPTIIDSLVESGDIRDSFSLCLDQGTQSGAMTFGAMGSGGGSAVYTPILSQTFYVVNFLSLTVGSASSPLPIPPRVYNAGQAIVDSGTTDFLIPSSAYGALHQSFLSLCSSGSKLTGVCGLSKANSLFGDYCFDMTEADISAFPTLTVSLQGTTSDSIQLAVTPDMYLTLDTPGSTLRCLGIVGVPEADGTILGDVVMRGFVTYFDRANSQVGFAPRTGACA